MPRLGGPASLRRPLLGVVLLGCLAHRGADTSLGFGLPGGEPRLLGHGAAPPRRATRRAAGGQETDIDFSRRYDDLLSGEAFSKKATKTFAASGNAELLLGLTLVVGSSALFGLAYNALGQIALLTTPGAKPGLDGTEGLLIQALAGLLSFAGFFFLRQRRTEALRKMDCEFRFLGLEYERLDGTGIGGRMLDLQDRRVMAIFGQGEELEAALRKAAAYRRRWETSGILVVAVAPSLPKDLAGRWLALARAPEDWCGCRDELAAVSGGGDGGGAVGQGCSWIMFGKTGRVRGTSVGDSFDEVIGFIGVEDDLSLRPKRAPGVGEGSDDVAEVTRRILAAHDTFYEALIAGDAAKMRPLWATAAAGGAAAAPDPLIKQRVPWESVLSEKAAVLDVVDVDVVFTRPDLTEAAVTSIEVCAGSPGFLNEGGPGGKGTLLATKRFRLVDGCWLLDSHQTIPYCRNTLATQSLRCNCNGCILLKPK